MMTCICGDKQVKGLHIRLVQGNKSKDDRIILIKTGCNGTWLKLSDLSLFTLIELRMKIEDILYPPPAQGRHYFGDCVDRIQNGKSAEQVFNEKTVSMLMDSVNACINCPYCSKLNHVGWFLKL